jgi:hypothetical protein
MKPLLGVGGEREREIVCVCGEPRFRTSLNLRDEVGVVV